MLSLTFSIRLRVWKTHLHGCLLGSNHGWVSTRHILRPRASPHPTSGRAPCSGGAQSPTGLLPAVTAHTQGGHPGQSADVSTAQLPWSACPRGGQEECGTHVPTKAGLPFAQVTRAMTREVMLTPAADLQRACPAPGTCVISFSSPGRQALLNPHVTAEEGKACAERSCTPSLVPQLVKNLPAMWETWVQSLRWEDPLETGKATHSSMLAWGRKELDTTEQLALHFTSLPCTSGSQAGENEGLGRELACKATGEPYPQESSQRPPHCPSEHLPAPGPVRVEDGF